MWSDCIKAKSVWALSECAQIVKSPKTEAIALSWRIRCDKSRSWSLIFAKMMLVSHKKRSHFEFQAIDLKWSTFSNFFETFAAFPTKSELLIQSFWFRSLEGLRISAWDPILASSRISWRYLTFPKCRSRSKTSTFSTQWNGLKMAPPTDLLQKLLNELQSSRMPNVNLAHHSILQ